MTLREQVATRFFSCLFVLFLATAALAGQARLVKDINLRHSAVDSYPGGLASLGNVTFFFANDWKSGNELWKTDGTEAGTVLVRDIAPGRDSGVPTNRFGAFTVNGRVVFVGKDFAYGEEAWASDGTAEGTVRLADIVPGRGSSDILFGKVAGSLLYFTATSPALGTELWRTDGTPGGTRLVKDIHTGPDHAWPRILGRLGSRLVFYAWNGAGSAVYITDGTTLGTQLVLFAEARTGVSFGDEVLFSVSEVPGTWSLAATDGTGRGTRMVRRGFTGTSDGIFRVAGETAFFVANDGIHGREVWRTDGTAGGTTMVADLTPGAEGSEVVSMEILDGQLLVMTNRDRGQLWISAGTAAGTRLVAEKPRAAAGFVFGDTYYFAWDDGTHGFEPWKSDGTPEGTTLVADVMPGREGSMEFAWFIERPDGFFFVASDGAAGLEPWVSDGTAAGTRMAKNVARDVAVGSAPAALARAGETLFFSADDGTSSALWTANAAGASRLEVPEEMPGPADIGIASGGLYYFAVGGHSSPELWRTDGTVEGTFRLFEGFAGAMLPFKGGLFLQRATAEHGGEPWFTDGTVAGTRILGDLEPGPSGSFSYPDPTVIGDSVHFTANEQVWRTDGTAAGTRMLPAPEGVELDSPGIYTHAGDSIFFVDVLHDAAFDLWRMSIATGEMVLVRHFDRVRPPGRMGNSGGTLVFTLDTFALEVGEVWRSDGTEAGTMRIAEGIPLPCYNRQDFVEAHGVYYWYVSRNYAPELWRTDGTAAGTFALAKFDGPYATSLQTCLDHPLLYSNGRLYFTGNDFVYGAELWVTDGTAAGTRLLTDVNPGPGSSDPGSLVIVGNTLYFTASDDASGQELWALSLGEFPRRRAVGR
ncbi:MAG TPA: ELWxxDGT repeat protein [Thermoanaerobaculia bacterium]|nr:ELWxxDGT repeat protein [Thermoanaerobaculia bacterium]